MNRRILRIFHVSEMQQHTMVAVLGVGIILLFTSATIAFSDTYDREFRPGPNVPEGFEPGPGVDARGLDLSGSHFIGMDLSGADFEGANLRNARFLQVRFGEGASFKNADLRGAFFEYPDVYTGCSFSGALITNMTRLEGERFLSADQIQSTRSYAVHDLSGLHIVGKASYPRSIEGDASQFEEVTMDLSGFNLHETMFAYGDYTGCNFHEADLLGATFLYARIEENQLRSAQVDNENVASGQYSVFEGLTFSAMDLSGWDLSDQILRGCRFSNSLLEETNFTNADLRGADCGKDFTIEHIVLSRSYQQQDLSGATFTAVDFSSFNFSFVNLSNATFRYCVFNEADFNDAVITGADFSLCRKSPPTPEQIQSTWNYKNDRMEEVVLPDDLVASLAAD